MEKTISVRRTTITFSIWDLGGQREFVNMLPLVCNDAVAILFMFDLSRKSTLNSVKEWYRQARGFNKVGKVFSSFYVRLGSIVIRAIDSSVLDDPELARRYRLSSTSHERYPSNNPNESISLLSTSHTDPTSTDCDPISNRHKIRHICHISARRARGDHEAGESCHTFHVLPSSLLFTSILIPRHPTSPRRLNDSHAQCMPP